MQTPREYVVLSKTSAGQALAEHFNRRFLGILPQNRYCQGLLLLPQNHSDYLRGRSRQALRTNLRRAAAAGIQCEVVTDPHTAVDDIHHVLRHQWVWLTEAELNAVMDDVRAAVARPEMTIAVGRDRYGRPLAMAMAAAIIDDTVCLIRGAVATNHEARWALHDHLVRLLISRRVRYLLADGGGPFGAIGFAANVQHYQHLLGYQLRHVVPVGTRRLTLRRRVVASLVLVAAAAGVVVQRATACTGTLAAVTQRTSRQALRVTPPRRTDELRSIVRERQS